MKIIKHPDNIHIQLQDNNGSDIYSMSFSDGTDNDTINPNYLDDESLDRAIMLTYTAYKMLKDRRDHGYPIPAISDLEHEQEAPDNDKYTF